jgi:hypothetical protein
MFKRNNQKHRLQKLYEAFDAYEINSNPFPDQLGPQEVVVYKVSALVLKALHDHGLGDISEIFLLMGDGEDLLASNFISTMNGEGPETARPLALLGSAIKAIMKAGQK